jgi:hypothetical protein
MKREMRALLARATDSLFLSIDQPPLDRGQSEAVIIFLDRAVELLLKGIDRRIDGRFASICAAMGAAVPPPEPQPVSD